jgi:hypothetical protein
MSTRTRCTSVTFAHPFELNGIGRMLSPGDYRVVTDEEVINCLLFPVYRRVATMMFVPGAPRHTSFHATFGPRSSRTGRRIKHPT